MTRNDLISLGIVTDAKLKEYERIINALEPFKYSEQDVLEAVLYALTGTDNINDVAEALEASYNNAQQISIDIQIEKGWF